MTRLRQYKSAKLLSARDGHARHGGGDLDGVTIGGATADELVQNVKGHAAENHPDLVGKLTDAQILAAAKDVA